MYNSQVTADRIKRRAKEQGVSMTQLNEICELSKNTIAQAGRSQEGMKAKNLYTIADYLDCSVDYLLGRTDEPTPERLILIEEEPEPKSTDIKEEFLKVFDTLDFADKLEIMNSAMNKMKKST